MFNLLGDKLNDEMLWRPELLLKSIEKPHSSDDFYLWGIAHYEKGDLGAAEKYFKRALELSLHHVPSLFALSQFCFEAGKVDEGKRWFSRGILHKPKAEHVILFQKSLRVKKQISEPLGAIKLWCLHQVTRIHPDHALVQFEIGKLLFEQSKFEHSAAYFEAALSSPKVAREAAEYLSYVFETLYRGDELVTRTLEMVKGIDHKADVLFNLAMACQHDQKRMDLALHLFYLSSVEDPSDPGLRFSLEQTALEIIEKKRRMRDDDDKMLLMFAHYYQGALGLAKKLYFELKDHEFPQDFFQNIPVALWQEWLLKPNSPLDLQFKSWRKSSTPVYLTR